MDIKKILSFVFANNASPDIFRENIINNVPHFIFWKSMEGVFLGCNKVFAQAAGFQSSDEVIGKTDYEMPWKENAAEYLEDDKHVMANASAKLNYEEMQRQLDGSEKIMLVSKVPMLSEKKEVIGVLGIYTDITERKKMEAALLESKEAAEAANHAKTAFLQNVRHDIRIPLSGIIGFAEMLEEEAEFLKDEIERNKVKEYVKPLIESSRELFCFLSEILESINVASGDLPVLKKKFDLRDTLERLVNFHRAKAAEKKLKLNLHFDTAIPKFLIGDPLRIYRIVLEFLVNALKFTEKGHVSIYVQLAKKGEDARDNVIRIIIEDTGIGISSDQQNELFLRFKRLTPSYQGVYKGTGLGLSIAKQFIDDLDGEIDVESEIGKGTRFICIFSFKQALLDDPLLEGADNLSRPIKISSEAIENQVASSENHNKDKDRNIEADTGESIRVLIVEDERIAAMVVQAMLSRLGCVIDWAINGSSGIELAQQNAYDLIFMDIGLPDIDGYEVTKRIREEEEKSGLRSLIIGLTGHLQSEVEQDALASGMNQVFTKPLHLDKAKNLVQSLKKTQKGDG